MGAALDSVVSAFIGPVMFADHEYSNKHFSFELSHILTE